MSDAKIRAKMGADLRLVANILQSADVVSTEGNGNFVVA